MAERDPKEPQRRLINYNGTYVIPDWPFRVESAQKQTHYVVDGETLPRVPYAHDEPCHDCAVIRGQLHVPGCDEERCPKCHGQALGCECFIDDLELEDDEEEEDDAEFELEDEEDEADEFDDARDEADKDAH